MRIVSLNAWGGAMFDSLAEWLPTVGADVVCVQEVTRTPGVGGWTTFTDADRVLPQRATLFDDLRALLPAHQASFVACDCGPVVTDDGVEHRQDFGMAMFVAEHLPVVGHLTRYVHGAFAHHRHWPVGDRPRLAQGVRVVDVDRDRYVTVVHTHGVRDPAGKHDTPARTAQAHRLAEVVDGLRGPGDLAVVCGDLNLLPDSETFTILGGLGLTDLVGWADTRTSAYRKPLRHANYCLVSDRSAVRRFEALASPEVSDHRPLVLDL